MLSIKLPAENGTLEEFTLPEAEPIQPYPGKLSRIAYAAAHVVADASDKAKIDWEATVRYREYLWSMNLGVAEAMDTAQRGTGLSWQQAKTLIRHTLEVAKEHDGALVASGCGTDQLEPLPGCTVDDVVAAYEEQVGFVEGLGGKAILMASRALAAVAKSPDDYIKAYGRILSQVSRPIIIHWLGEMFDPALQDYWGSSDQEQAMETVLNIISANRDKVDGIKISLLDKEKEISLRRRLPENVRMYTGDDFNFPELIAGDGNGHSDALLGIFDAIAPSASVALGELAQGNTGQFHEILKPTVSLSRHIFSEPTRFYKTGIVFLAWLNGHQEHFTMLGGQESSRSIWHLAETFRLATNAGLLNNPELAVERMRTLCKLQDIDA